MFFEGEAAKVGVTPVTATGTVAETPTPTATPTPRPAARRTRLGHHDHHDHRDHRRGDEVSRTYKILLVLVVAVLAGGGYWKMVLAPKRVEAADLAERVAVAEAQVAQSQALSTTYRGAQKDYKANYETVVRLGKAVPTDDDTRSLLVQLDASAKRAGADFDSINLNGGASSSADPTAAAPAAPGAVNAGAFSAHAVQLRLHRNVRLARRLLRSARALRDPQERVDRGQRPPRAHREPHARPGRGRLARSGRHGRRESYIVPETTAVSADAAGATTTATSAATTTTTTTTSEPGTETR